MQIKKIFPQWNWHKKQWFSYWALLHQCGRACDLSKSCKFCDINELITAYPQNLNQLLLCLEIMDYMYSGQYLRKQRVIYAVFWSLSFYFTMILQQHKNLFAEFHRTGQLVVLFCNWRNLCRQAHFVRLRCQVRCFSGSEKPAIYHNQWYLHWYKTRNTYITRNQ